jgi:hypothetical protein
MATPCADSRVGHSYVTPHQSLEGQGLLEVIPRSSLPSWALATPAA